MQVRLLKTHAGKNPGTIIQVKALEGRDLIATGVGESGEIVNGKFVPDGVHAAEAPAAKAEAKAEPHKAKKEKE